VSRLTEQAADAGLAARLGPAIAGLGHAVAGGRFTAAGTVDGRPGRRLLGWCAGPHWLLDEAAPGC
jgi:hypothetical protein